MLEKIKQWLRLNPKSDYDERVGIQVGVFEGKLHIKFSRKVDVLTLDKNQLTQLLAAVASQAAGVK